MSKMTTMTNVHTISGVQLSELQVKSLANTRTFDNSRQVLLDMTSGEVSAELKVKPTLQDLSEIPGILR